MPRTKKEGRASFKLPEVEAGPWKGEFLGGCSVSFGQEVQAGPPRQSVEFSYLTTPAAFTMPAGRFMWPGVVMIFAPTPMKTFYEDAGCLLRSDSLPSLHLALDVTRPQFSDLLRMIEAKRLKKFHFTVEDGQDGKWPIRSWGMATPNE